jgi:alkanesulfonate monooxygenase SsuD/methylene tetrahydromethanopterin reductase-like flavin-dependent oxidoreductase (luciferase family)
MKVGIWHDFRNPPPWHRPYDRLYRENLDQVAWAEELGFESVWLSEHHVTEDGYLPSPFPMLAALAERTRTMRLGTSIMLAPFVHPLRFAEDVAVADQLSGGRVEIGLGLGYRAREFELLDVPIAARAARTETLVETARRAWNDGTVTPPSHQRPEPPLWIGGATAAAARRAARLGCGFLPDAYVADDVLRLYRDLGGTAVGVNPTVHLGDWAEISEHVLYQHNNYAAWGGRPLRASADDLSRDRYIVGEPELVIDRLNRLITRTGCDRLYFWARLPGLPIELANRSLERFAREVLLHLRDGGGADQVVTSGVG